MKVFDSKVKNIAYFSYRIINPIFDPIRFVHGIYGYLWFVKDLILFKIKDKNAKLLNINLYPRLDEKTSFTSFDAQNFYQQLWAFEQILKKKPALHVDIGSSNLLSGYISKITKVIFIDLRPIQAKLHNLETKRGEILNLPFEDSSLKSLSCLCVAGHVGLGRYGDAIDPQGTKKACKELGRVLARGGYLYFSTNIGKERICFNAHRVLSPRTILDYFKNLKLLSFSVVDDSGNFYENVNYKDYLNIDYGQGMFLFNKQ